MVAKDVYITKHDLGYVMTGEYNDALFKIDFNKDGYVTSGRIRPLYSFDGTGPGSQLSRILVKHGLSPCQQCNKTKVLMDIWGPDKCEEEIEVIVDKIKSNAEEQGLPFNRTVAEELVKFAIEKSRKLQNAEE